MRVELVNTQDALIKMEARLGPCRTIAIDVETTMLDTFCNDFALVGISLAGNTQTGYYIPLWHKTHPSRQNPPENIANPVGVLARLDRFLIGRRIVGANHKFEHHVFDRYGLRAKTTVFDVLTAATVLDSRDARSGLKALVFKYLGYRPQDIETLCADVKPPKQAKVPKIRQRMGIEFLEPSAVLSYAAADSVNAMRLREIQAPALKRTPDLSNVFGLEMTVMPVLKRMEAAGILLNADTLRDLHEKCVQHRDKAVAEVIRIAGNPDLNVRSGAQMGEIIYKQMQLPHPDKRKYKGGVPPTGWMDANTLRQHLVYLHSTSADQGRWSSQEAATFLDARLQASTLEKLRSTYTLSLINLVADDGRLHTSFRQMVETGRLACVSSDTVLETSHGRFCISDPKLLKNQNISIMSHKGRMCRILRQYRKGYEEMFHVRVSTGDIITCTGEHKILTPEGWTEVRDLRVGRRVINTRSTLGDPKNGFGFPALRTSGPNLVARTKVSNEIPDADFDAACAEYARLSNQGIALTDAEFLEHWKALTALRATEDQGCYITSITGAGVRAVWDIEVADDHSYYAHGMFHHNSSNPNLQNIPRGDNKVVSGFGIDIRSAFVADPGYVFVRADYSAQEMRMIAALSNDPTLKAIFAGELKDAKGREVDVHTYVAAPAFNKVYEDIADAVEKKVAGEHLTTEETALVKCRQDAKPVNFGIGYGITAVGLALQLMKPKDFAEYLLTTWKTRVFPTAARWLEGQKQYLREHLYTQTYLGRRRTASRGLLGVSRHEFDHLANAYVNAPIQGGAADMMKIAMIKTDEALQREFGDKAARMVLQVHDEIVCLAAEDVAEDVLRTVCACMDTEILGVKFPSEGVISRTLSKLD